MHVIHWPVEEQFRRITQGFGAPGKVYTEHGLAGHEGLDLGTPEGTPIYAAHTGVVAVLWAPASYGRYLTIECDWIITLYGHLSRALRDGETVRAGTLIGYSGNTGGTSTGAHLHFGAKLKPVDVGNGYKGWVNPLPLLQEGERAMSELITPARWHSEQATREIETLIAQQETAVAAAQTQLDAAQAQLVALRVTRARLRDEVTPRLYEMEK